MMELADAQGIVLSSITADWKRDYYDKLYSQYELDYLPHMVRMIESLSGLSVLDIGPGWGTMMMILAGSGWDVTVMDCEPPDTYISPKLLQQARARYVQNDILAGHMPEKFDLVLCTQVLLHLKYRPDRAVRNIAAMVARHGMVIFSALKPECYPVLKSAYGAGWREMPEYGKGDPVPEIVTCLLPPGVFLELIETAFSSVEILMPSDSTVMFAKCQKPKDGI